MAEMMDMPTEIIGFKTLWKKGNQFIGLSCTKIDMREDQLSIKLWIQPFSTTLAISKELLGIGINIFKFNVSLTIGLTQ
jgi:hypothetical protein|tara:strand:+ start:1142 stop:1378 length:237 start_codon:yes stop_codon:yes gene_type:complete